MTDSSSGLWAARGSRPPRLEAGAEVLLGPRGHGDGAILDDGVAERQGQRRRAADNLALVVVLRAVARADEPVRLPVPGHDAAQVGADRVDAEVLDARLRGHDVGGIALQALDKLTLVELVGLHPHVKLHGVAVLVASRDGTAGAAANLREEVEDVAAGQHGNGDGAGRDRDEVHQHAALHVRHEAGVLAGVHRDRGAGGGGHGGAHEGHGGDVERAQRQGAQHQGALLLLPLRALHHCCDRRRVR
mmetsp:Transcript_14424/g.38259  ORF Transcript_14424/g.38259 Transcript_14424/m.38259 type:complete len:246 (+) Transcript_14424:73-810(+)